MYLPPDFESAARTVLAFLSRRIDFGLWMVTRTEGDDWIALQVQDRRYGIVEGSVFRWSDSVCARMASGEGPRVAPCLAHVPAYANAPIGEHIPIGAYVGVPLTRCDGTLFGTLCAIDPSPMPETLADEQELIETLASLLSAVLQSELKLLEQTRRTERVEAAALTDSLTGLFDFRAWRELLSAEEVRCRTLGHPAQVLFIDLDEFAQFNLLHGHGEGDALLQRVADALSGATGEPDVLARIGGDDFAVLAVDADGTQGEALEARLRDALAQVGAAATIGRAPRDPGLGLTAAWEAADLDHYRKKRRSAHRELLVTR